MISAAASMHKCTATSVAPVGRSYTYDRVMEIIKQITDITADDIVTVRKLLNSLIEVIAGKIIKADIIIEPIILIPSTIVTAVSTAISI